MPKGVAVHFLQGWISFDINQYFSSFQRDASLGKLGAVGGKRSLHGERVHDDDDDNDDHLGQ